jgi:lysine biosynthesis protein LysW
MDALDIDLGEVISCPECGVELRVLGLAPIELAGLDVEDEDDDGAWSDA